MNLHHRQPRPATMITQTETSTVEGCSTDLQQRDLIAKYDVSGPRYTSYPTALNFSDDYQIEDYRQSLGAHSDSSIAPLSLYLHIPFCKNICYYCACNKIVSKDSEDGRRYLDHLHREIALQSELAGRHRTVTQLHLGGGTPTFLDSAELTELMHSLASHFKLTDSPEREYSIEIDPRTVNKDSLALLKGLGFNRLSLGVQDFEPAVQQAINRLQSIEMVAELTEVARLHQFKSISYDLIYGLPHQSPDSLARTLDQVISLAPDRIAFYNYAHLPERFVSQRAIGRHDLPSACAKLDMLALIADKLSAAGYLYIGMDHFVKPDDDLAIAQQQGSLQRNFQGYSTCMASDLIGMGVSAISSLSDGFAQNEKTLPEYYQRIESGDLAIVKGLKLNDDDRIRAAVIRNIICQLELDIPELEKQFDISFADYFSDSLERLKPMAEDGLIHTSDSKLQVTERGRSMLRNICMVFDGYLKDNSAQRFSKAL